MADGSTTIRVSHAQRSKLKGLAERRSSSMTETLDAALEALRRNEFYRLMADTELELRSDAEAWAGFAHDRNQWLGAKLT